MFQMPPKTAPSDFTEVYKDHTIRVASGKYVVPEISPYERHDGIEDAKKAIRKHIRQRGVLA